MAIREQHGVFRWDDEVGHPGNGAGGGWSDNLYQDNVRGTTGSASFYPDDNALDSADDYSYENTFVTSDYRRESEDSDELAEAVGELLFALTMMGIVKAAPHVKKWWQEQAGPAVSRQAKKVRNFGRKKKPEIAVSASAEEYHMAVTVDRRQIMSKEEAMSRFIAALAARAFSDEQLRMVNGARILEVENYTDIERTIAQLPPEQLQAQILEMVKNPALLEDASLADLASTLDFSSQPIELTP